MPVAIRTLLPAGGWPAWIGAAFDVPTSIEATNWAVLVAPKIGWGKGGAPNEPNTLGLGGTAFG